MATYKTKVTDVGAAALTAAIAASEEYVLTHMAVGDGGGSPITPTGAETALTNELYRAPQALLQPRPDYPNQLIAEFPVPWAELAGETIREAGIFDENGVLFAICNLPAVEYPATGEGCTIDPMIRMVFETTNADDFTLYIDPTVVYATQQYVQDYMSAAAMLEGPVEAYPGQNVQYQITNYNSFYSYTALVDAPNDASVVGDIVVLSVDAAQAPGILELHVNCNGFLRSFDLTVLAAGIPAPSITSPAEGEDVSPLPMITSSNFAVFPPGGDTHEASQWQIAEDAAFTTILDDSGETTTALTSYTADWLDMGQDVYIRVRHKGTTYGWSDWSDTVCCHVAGTDWFTWDGSNDGPVFEAAASVDFCIMDMVAVSDTDLIVVTDADGDGISINLNYLRRNGTVLQRVGVSNVTLCNSTGGSVPYTQGTNPVRARLHRGRILLSWGIADEIYIQFATYNRILGTVTAVGSPEAVIDGLTGYTGSGKYGCIHKIIQMGNTDRFVCAVWRAGSLPAANTSQMAGFYIDPADDSVTTGGTEVLSASDYICDITYYDADTFITVESRDPTSIVIRTWEMPGLVITEMDASTNAGAFSPTTSGSRYPTIQVYVLPSGAIMILSALDDVALLLSFSIGADNHTISSVATYFDDDASGPFLLDSLRGLESGSNRLAMPIQNSAVYLGYDLSMARVVVSASNVITVSSITYAGAADQMTKTNMPMYVIPEVAMTGTYKIAHTVDDGTIMSSGIMLLNGEV